MRIASAVLVSLSAATTLIVSLSNFDWKQGGFVVALGFLVWSMLPFCAAAAALRKSRSTAGSVCMVLIAIACAVAAFAYVDGFYIHLDAQSALLFVVVPLLQGIIVGPLYAIAALASRRSAAAKLGVRSNPE
jgi:MFS family permease